MPRPPADTSAATTATLSDALDAGIADATRRVGPSSRVVLAVSGGPDSLALLLAAAALARRMPTGGPDFLVVTVDHGLRPESSAEAAFVASVAEAHGLRHRTMRLARPLPPGNVPAAARRGRYACLVDAARDAGAGIVVTAHHEDDQFETHLHALARQAGPVGLAAMRPVRDLAPGIVLLRPFLAVPGACLKAVVAASGIAAINDPSNHDLRYERTRLRLHLAGADIDRPGLRRQIARHRRERDALEAALAAFVRDGEAADTLSFGDDGVLRLGREAFRQLAAPAAFAFLARAVQAVSGGDYAPGAPSLLRLQAALSASSAPMAATLGGVVVDAGPDAITFLREYGRAGIEPVPVAGGTAGAVFDGRFLVEPVPTFALAGVRLEAFGATGRGNRVERTLPVLVGEAGLLAVPGALARKAAPGLPRLCLTPLLRWRLLRDLPPPAGLREEAASAIAAKAPARVGKAGDNPYLPRSV
ncbi:tRNA lysidine(34) synthetase TilS [Aurantimonas sp. HBX-1]|uniref:tRNA lysidine(34) synthetase TilS n=1 Tax=Aurantimonas sp. HBX-1 TaxID=2906072 RepID=UPI001F3F18AC|nr:tRNA lysidine(34) synthetase TilS [Aurantimonas sp. HBX-1]UIJ70818.1 tRNA lysidine(34) synthetase TilS [Aurantimonas sp. HBX-1]